MMKNVKMALIYDFDKTLSPKDMQEFHYLKRLGYKNPQDFWDRCEKLKNEMNIDGILSYMYLMSKEDKNLTRDSLREEGKYVKFYKGVDTWFKRINAYGKKHHVDVEHYVISSGIKDIIKGTSIAKEFKKIYACDYYCDENGKILWPSRVVNYTAKTQYIFRINKGVLDETNDIDLNKSTPDEDKYIPYERMIYFGDGLTDVPSMKVVAGFGGNTVAVYSSKKELAMDLYNAKRATFASKADYSEGSKIEKIVMAIIDQIEARSRLEDIK